MTCAIGTSFLFSGAASTTAFPAPPAALAANIDMTFENGNVRLDDPLRSFGNDLKLRQPQFLGSGGGGAVFACSRAISTGTGGSSPVVVKISWVRSAASVERECEILKYLERTHVEGVERCLGKTTYPTDSRRTMIVMVPVVDDSVASVSEIRTELQAHSVKCIARTLIQMLAIGVATTDVQPFISRTTGDVLFIDMTEAKIISRSDGEPISFLDMALASSFCSEMLGLVPEEYGSVASKALVDELKEMEARGDKLPQGELLNLLQGQVTFLSSKTVDYIDGKL